MKIDTVTPPVTGSNAVAPAPLSAAAGAPASASPPLPLSPAQALKPTSPPPGTEVALQAARQINEFLKSSSANVEFTVDAESKRVVVRVVDAETGQVIRQMPSEEMLAISHALDRVSGLLLTQKA